jgi:hypothetical protein
MCGRAFVQETVQTGPWRTRWSPLYAAMAKVASLAVALSSPH